MSKIIAIYGSPGSGRSTLAVALAARLSAHRQNVIVLSTNRTVPMLKVLVPSESINQRLSVGGLFLSGSITQDDVCRRIVFHPKCPALGFMGLASGDTPNTYNKIFRPENIKTLYSILLNLAEILIVDCMSNISPGSEPLGATALLNSNLIIKLLTPDVYGIEYNKAIFPLLRDYTGKEQITAFGKCSPVLPVDETAAVLDEEIKYFLPVSSEISGFFLSGRLITNAVSRDGRAYLAAVNKIAKVVEACQS